MLTLSNLKPKIKRVARRRVGRGSGSGLGNYSGRGMKGQKARSGGSIRPGFEGGRMPLIRQMPKMRGFKSIYPKSQIVDLSEVERLIAKSSVDAKTLKEAGLVDNEKMPIKILGRAALTKKLEFKGIKFSRGAQKAVEAAGGKVG